MMKTRLLCWQVLAAAVLATSAAAGAASAGTTVTETTVEKQFTFSQPSCIEAEQVVLTGTIRHRFRMTVDENGGLHLDDYYSAHGSGSGFNVVTDPGLLTPVSSYVASDEQIQSTYIREPMFVNSVVFNTRVVRKGESVREDDLTLRTRVHITINANRIPVVRADDSLECN
jgi:hypothetical protein